VSGNVLWLNGLGEYDFFGRILKDLRILDKEPGLNSASLFGYLTRPMAGLKYRQIPAPTIRGPFRAGKPPDL
jgi:hypothetical protein